MIYVFPNCSKFEKEICEINGIGRLFAFPTVPYIKEDSPIVILDSGAFALNGKQMSKDYMINLSEHYKKYNSENTICVAPDVINNPLKTMQNYKNWIDSGLFSQISPVIQPQGKRTFSLESYKFQIDYYVKNFSPKKMLFANWLTAQESIGLGIYEAVMYAKEKGVEWVHILGAGWNLRDVETWASVKAIDSIDSIAYYTKGCDVRFGSKNPVENVRRIIKCIKRISQPAL